MTKIPSNFELDRYGLHLRLVRSMKMVNSK